MKRIVLILLGVLLLNGCCSRSVEECVEPLPQNEVYKLYPTSNMWTFIKLNTSDGRMWQVQYDVQGDNRFEVPLNTVLLVDTTKTVVAERFELYATENIFNFILLDRVDGRTWQVQWSMNEENRGMVPISVLTE